jgi:hypothetical protein
MIGMAEPEEPGSKPPTDDGKKKQPTQPPQGDSTPKPRQRGKDKDEPSEPSETGELKTDKPTPVVSLEDSKIDQLIARASASEGKIEQLIAVNKELSLFFQDQLEAIEFLRQSLKSLQGFVESDATLKKKFDKYLQKQERTQDDPQQIQKLVRLRGMLSRLERSGIF